MLEAPPTNPGSPSPAGATTRDEPAIAFDAVSRQFVVRKRAVPALRSISWSAAAGKITALIGPDGAGKTTLMRLAAGLLHPDEGTVRIFGADTVTRADAVRAAIGYMPQRFGLYEDLTVQENLDLYADLQGVRRVERPERFERLLAMGGLAPFTNRLAGRLSGGMKQKLGLVCTLLRTPRLLLLDEPTVGVDPVSRRDLWSIITRARTETGMSVLMSTAYLDEAARCDAFMVLDNAEVLASGTPADFARALAGRVFTCTVEASDRRIKQRHASAQPGVVDALLRGNELRIVIESQASARTLEAITGPLTPAPPAFEDAFIDLLYAKTSGNADEAPAKTPVENAEMQVQGTPSTEKDDEIRVEEVTRSFGAFKAVNKVSFAVRRGEVFGLLGANGAGKTTTFRMLCGLLPASEGMLSVAGMNMRRAPAAARARIGYMSQGFALYGELSVQRNLRFFAGAYGLRAARRRERMDWAIAEFELDPVLSMRSETLPLGYKQRLAFACALMHEPSVLFLDEPTSGVDPLGRRIFWRRIEDLSSRGVTVLVTTHFMEEAEYCDRLVIMVTGEVAAYGTPDAIRAQGAQAGAASASMEDTFLAIVGATQGTEKA
jgi:ABC-type multidrug transport system ATPase subunit